MALKFIPDAINFYYPLFKRYFTTYPDQHEVDFQVILHLILELHRNAWRNKKLVYDLHPSFLMHNFLQPLFLRKHKGYIIQQKVLPSKIVRSAQLTLKIISSVSSYTKIPDQILPLCHFSHLNDCYYGHLKIEQRRHLCMMIKN